MRERFPISECKAKCLALLEQVRRTSQPLRITRHGEPVAEVVPPSAAVDLAKRIGSMKGKMKIKGDIAWNMGVR